MNDFSATNLQDYALSVLHFGQAYVDQFPDCHETQTQSLVSWDVNCAVRTGLPRAKAEWTRAGRKRQN